MLGGRWGRLGREGCWVAGNNGEGVMSVEGVDGLRGSYGYLASCGTIWGLMLQCIEWFTGPLVHLSLPFVCTSEFIVIVLNVFPY